MPIDRRQNIQLSVRYLQLFFQQGTQCHLVMELTSLQPNTVNLLCLLLSAFDPQGIRPALLSGPKHPVKSSVSIG